MPTKRQVLEQLKRDELLVALDAHDLTVDDRRQRALLVDALARSRKARLEDVLATLSRDRLKELCRVFGLDDSGRAKAVIAARLSGKAPADAKRRAPQPKATAQPSAEPSSASAKAASTRTASTEPGKLTREQLEGYLWSAADILRGSIDSSDYKNYIFGLLFLKRLSDRFEEECEALEAEGYDPDDPDEHQFFVSERARWSHVRRATTNIGEVLNMAASDLEETNPSLEGVLAGTDYNDERKLGDTRQRDSTLHRLVLHFSEIDLRNANLSEPVVRLLVEILDPQEGMRICDPTCGSGGMLIQSAAHIRRHADTRN